MASSCCLAWQRWKGKMAKEQWTVPSYLLCPTHKGQAHGLVTSPGAPPSYTITLVIRFHHMNSGEWEGTYIKPQQEFSLQYIGQGDIFGTCPLVSSRYSSIACHQDGRMPWAYFISDKILESQNIKKGPFWSWAVLLVDMLENDLPKVVQWIRVATHLLFRLLGLLHERTG